MKINNTFGVGGQRATATNEMKIEIITSAANNPVAEYFSSDEAKSEIQRLRYESQREAEHHDKMVGELEKVYAERDAARGMAEEADAAHDMAIADLARCEKSVDVLVQRATELIGRWDSPSWKEAGPTARFIEKLREAVASYEGREVPKKPCPLPLIDERYKVVKKAPRTKRRRRVK